jgi:Flp pilus assembly protein TadG
MNGWTPILRGDRGQSTVELAIILPVLLILLIGIIDVAVGVNAYVTVTDASREAASYAVLHPTASPAAITSAATTRSAPLASVSVTTSYYNSSTGTWAQWTTGLPSHSPTATSIPGRVDVSYAWSASTILIGQFFRGAPVTFHGVSTMVATW